MISLVLGLGNVGEKYAGTRHNVGFEVLYRVEKAVKAKAKRSAREYDWAVVQRDDRKVILARPKTYMNRSGAAAEVLLQRNKLSPLEMLVVVDDFALPLGTLRFRMKGSDGGHNGLASLIETLGTTEFPRLRLGIGPLPTGVDDSAEFVLSKFGRGEKEPARKMIETAAEAVVFAIDNRLELAMSRYNSSPALPEDH